MAPYHEQLPQILLDEGYISNDTLEQAKASDKSTISYLLEEDFISHDLIGEAMAEFFHLPYYHFNQHLLDPLTVNLIPEKTAKKHTALLLEKQETTLSIVTADPQNTLLQEDISALFPDHHIKLFYALPEDIQAQYIHYRSDLYTRIEQLLNESEDNAPQIIETILDQAVFEQSSDIHFQPQEEDVLIQFRIDGMLQAKMHVDTELYKHILNKLKVDAQLRIDKHYVTQDGALRVTHDDNVYDIRISIVPTIYGEKAVLRLLTHYIKDISLSHLGASEEHQDIIRSNAKKPFGMILVAGPTGSGKTTTLYSLLQYIKDPYINITTLEDPVEYKLPGITQIQVRPEQGISFATGLKAIVRQDPDVILLGEIRDQASADIAVNAALTGHLLYSTFHANNAAAVIPRLLTMGIESFLLASSLELIIAQRLVRRICSHCKTRVTSKELETYPADLMAKYFPNKKTTLYRGKGCNRCHDTGYRGRIALFELIEVNEAIQQCILRQAAEGDIWHSAQQQGSQSLFDDGIEKIKKGFTTLEEVIRVAEPR